VRIPIAANINASQRRTPNGRFGLIGWIAGRSPVEGRSDGLRDAMLTVF